MFKMPVVVRVWENYKFKAFSIIAGGAGAVAAAACACGTQCGQPSTRKRYDKWPGKGYQRQHALSYCPIGTSYPKQDEAISHKWCCLAVPLWHRITWPSNCRLAAFDLYQSHAAT